MTMRRLILLAVGIGVAALAVTTASEAKTWRSWDPVTQKWIIIDGAKVKFFPTRSSYSPIKRRLISYDGPYPANTIVISTAERRLYYVMPGGKAWKYGVGVGREGFTWQGTDVVSRKAEWPGWTPPPEMIAREKKKGRILPAHMDGGIDNPLGARALYIGARMYRIHGSNEPWTIGSAVSSGCIRMTNDDVIDLYTKVSVGTRVVVLSGSSKQYIPFNPPVVASAKIPPKDVTEAPTKDDIVGTVPPADATAPADSAALPDGRSKDDNAAAPAAISSAPSVSLPPPETTIVPAPAQGNGGFSNAPIPAPLAAPVKETTASTAPVAVPPADSRTKDDSAAIVPVKAKTAAN